MVDSIWRLQKGRSAFITVGAQLCAKYHLSVTIFGLIIWICGADWLKALFLALAG